MKFRNYNLKKMLPSYHGIICFLEILSVGVDALPLDVISRIKQKILAHSSEI
jgi:hypothetical protein